jgi:hypothetical protein
MSGAAWQIAESREQWIIPWALDRSETIPESPILGGGSFLCCEVVTRGRRSSPPRNADRLALSS